MPDNNFPNQVPENLPVPPQGDQGIPSVPPQAEVPFPPSTESQVGIRTMTEDVSLLESSGGLEPRTQTFRPKDLLGNEPVFQPKDAAAVPSPSGDEARRHHIKMVAISAGAVVVIAVAAAAVYFLVLKKPAPLSPPPPPPPFVESIEPTPVEEVVELPPPPPPFEHRSLFPAQSGVLSADVNITAIGPDNLKVGVKALAAAETKIPALKEFALVTSEGDASADQFLTAMLPVLAASIWPIEKDFTSFFYKDKDGVWPGYVMEVSMGANISQLLAEMERSPKVFYLDDPGAPKATAFKEGAKFSANVQSIRYLQYTKVGASFNLATIKLDEKTYILLSTSFTGMKEAAKQLGF
ncbi:MAG: hypothetical protein A3B23_01725 [Candidatus Colwellbacteria bacterium RIFCSPLOWO2_01_FULL_48_10]|uniref:Uncharacterized protein n=1 Tax=Candidatus Colwellbacteria bacterium RIFCSPLOWO2_01_FULL_48_10 TaxID=1797690 RepID=A0A1G1Z791_9BACT|nr:MAG: hypothetical protein A3B23_01725 [Candidatus Colwellbacteria bacterium RIFCSPLOWO2_01_FULL_48_10]